LNIKYQSLQCCHSKESEQKEEFSIVASKAVVIALLLSGVVCCAKKDEVPIDKEKPELPQNTVLSDFLPFEVQAFENGGNTTKNLNFVDANNPHGSPKSIIANNGVITPLNPLFSVGDFDATTFSVKNERAETLLYREDNKLFSVQLNDVFAIENKPLSTEANANLLCPQWDAWASDYSNPTNSRYIYYLANDCLAADGGSWYMVSANFLNDNAPQLLPTNISHFISALYDSADGGLSGWLAITLDNRLVQYDVDLQVEKNISFNAEPLIVSYDVNLLSLNQEKNLILSDKNRIVLYDPLMQQVIAVHELYSTSEIGSVFSWRSNGDHVYFTLNKYNSNEEFTESVIYRVSLTEFTIDELHKQNSFIEIIELNSDGLMFLSFKKINKIHFDTLDVVELSIPDNFVFARDENQNIRIFTRELFSYVELVNKTNKYYRVLMVMNSKENIYEQLEFYNIVGVVYSKDKPFISDRTVDYLVVENFSRNAGLRQLYSIKANDYLVRTKVGELPIDSNPQLLSQFVSYGNSKILVDGKINFVNEIFFIDINIENSLTRVTNNNVVEKAVNL